MKRALIITFLIFMVVGSIFATTWSTLKTVDDFGDNTGRVRLYTIIEDVKYDPTSSWNCEDCAILIDEGYDDVILPYIVSFYVGYTAYSKWIVSTKLNDGAVHTYNFELYGSYLDPSTSDVAKCVAACNGLIEDFKVGCKVILYPDNKYSTYKYNLGYIILTDSDLSQI